RAELDRAVVVLDGAVIEPLVGIGDAAVVVGARVFRIEVDRLVVILDGAVVVLLGVEAVAAVVEGDREVLGGLASRMDHRRAPPPALPAPICTSGDARCAFTHDFQACDSWPGAGPAQSAVIASAAAIVPAPARMSSAPGGESRPGYSMPGKAGEERPERVRN